MPVPGVKGEVISILCQSAGLPERNIATTEIWHKGRKYVIRGETDYINEYEINIVDDSDMRLRNMFDQWLKSIDDSQPKSAQGGASFERGAVIPTPAYQTDINIWQMSGSTTTATNDSHKVYGYKLQNAYPKSIGIVTLESESENQLSQFSVNLAFSEFIPLYGNGKN